MSALKTETIVMGAGVLIAGLVLMKVLPKVGGLLTGDNALTKNAKNADGTPQTAYQGAGVVGTAGAAANVVSGGWLSTFGDWLGGGLYDATHSDPMLPSTAAAIDKYTQGGNAASGSGSIDLYQDPAMFGYNWGG